MFPYVSPEQQMKDRADFARKGIARGRAVVGVVYDAGVLFVAENPSSSLYKISELYDRLAFAAVGRYNEFESLRRQGIRLADVLGYQYARQDVTGRSMANAYANALGAAFSESQKPFEVELLVAEVQAEDVDLFHILYDGSVSVEAGSVAIGGQAEAISDALSERLQPLTDLAASLRAARDALASVEDREITAETLEVAGLDRNRGRRKFFRMSREAVAEALTG
ncbi:MAG TPA: proteasome subunit alpha [Euzebyales bacterium]|nr:proteasome subunit alpha [Euzebyales bacterium]